MLQGAAKKKKKKSQSSFGEMSDLAKFYEKKLHSLFISLSSAQNSKEKGPSQTLPFVPLPQNLGIAAAKWNHCPISSQRM